MLSLSNERVPPKDARATKVLETRKTLEMLETLETQEKLETLETLEASLKILRCLTCWGWTGLDSRNILSSWVELLM